MKIKPAYLYGILIIAAAVYLFFFTGNDNTAADNISMEHIPDDEIHKGLKNPGQTPPGKDNVSGEIVHQLEAMRKTVEENPGDTLKMRQLADLLAESHHPDEAVIYYYNILNINPRRTDILFSLAYIYYNKSNFDKAGDIIDKVLLYEPDNTRAIYNLGAIAATKGDKIKAKQYWEKLVNEYPGSDESGLAAESLKKL